MTGLTSLWLPIVLSAIAVFVLSSIIHMVQTRLEYHHQGDGGRTIICARDSRNVWLALAALATPRRQEIIHRPNERFDLVGLL